MHPANEPERRLRIAVVGCGSHAGRSIFPCLDYLPVELVATCDLDAARARDYAARFGARAAYASLEELLGREAPEALLLVVGPRQHPELTCHGLAAGAHVWMEKPPAMDVAGVERMITARDAAGKYVAVGFKKVFMPALRRMKALLESGRWGRIRTIQGRYPLDLPADGPAVLAEGRATNWLDNGVHALSAMLALGGRPEGLVAHRSTHGGGFILLFFADGAVGSLHLAQGHSMSGPLERYEVVGEQGHLVLDNNTRLTVYRPGYPFDYRSGTDFTAGGEEVAALVYEPQHTLSTLENKAIFLQGFASELEHFVSSCLEARPPTLGTLEFARDVMRCYEASLRSQGAVIRIAD